MSTHVTVSPNEAADRLAIRDLVEAHAHCADRREANGQMSLFAADTPRRMNRPWSGSLSERRTGLLAERRLQIEARSLREEQVWVEE